MRKFFAVIVVLVLLSGSAFAQDMSPSSSTGRDLYLLCSSKYDTDYGYCAGFVTAIAEMMAIQDINGLRACHIESTRSQQLVDNVRVYLTANPDLHSYSASDIVARALARAFPCF